MEKHPYVIVSGTPSQVIDEVIFLSDLYKADEVVVTTTCPELEDRIRMHRLVFEELRHRNSNGYL